MRNNIVAVAILATAAGVPIAARVQTVGVAHGTSVNVEGAPGIAVESYPAFREYVIGERIPNHMIPGSVAVGTILPDEEGITFYDVPSSFATTPYRYTVVNGETLLVEPHTRRVVEVIGPPSSQ